LNGTWRKATYEIVKDATKATREMYFRESRRKTSLEREQVRGKGGEADFLVGGGVAATMEKKIMKKEVASTVL